MRVAVLSDVHGNRIALDAVLSDAGRVDEYWVLGDLCAIGGDPNGSLERLRGLGNARFIRGNTDRYVVRGDRPPPTLDEVAQNPKLIPRLVQLNCGFAWTQGMVTASGHLDWLDALPLDFREKLGSTRVLAVHARPGEDDGAGVTPSTPDDVLEGWLDGCEADLVLVAHTHQVVDRIVNGVRVVNTGSVSNPPPGRDKRASYAILETTKDGYGIDQRWVDYDRRAAIELAREVRFPALDFLAGMLT